MRHELFPEAIYKELAHYDDNIVVELTYDGREEGNYIAFAVFSNRFGKPELDLLFNIAQYPSVYLFKGKLCIDVEIEL